MRYINLLLTLTSIHFTLTDDGRFYHVLLTFFSPAVCLRLCRKPVRSVYPLRRNADRPPEGQQHVYRTEVVSRRQKLLVDTKGQLRISPAARAKRRLDYGRLGTDMTLMLLQPCHLRPR